MTEATQIALESALERLEHFLSTFVEPLERANADLLADPRTRFTDGGVLTSEVLALRRRVRLAAADVGLHALFTPVALGGQGAGASVQFGVFEYLYARSGPDRLLPYDVIGTYTSGPGAGLVGLTPAARAGAWQEILQGDAVLCFALSEPGEPPPDRPLHTTATPLPNGGWSITGRKQWVSQGAFATYAIVYASTATTAPPGSEGISAFLVPLDAPGVTREPTTFLLGRPGGDEITVELADVVVPDTNVVGTLHAGRALALAGAPARTMHAAGRALGLSRWALDRATEFARDAVVFGRRLADDGIVLGDLARSAIEIAAGRSYAVEIAEAIDAGTAEPLHLSMVNAYTSETWGRVADRTMRIIGGDALRTEWRLYDGWQQSMIVRAAEGTAGPMLLGIGRGLLGSP